MTLTKYDRVAILPKRCDRCNRLFWLEGYNLCYKTVGIESRSLEQIKCKKCDYPEPKYVSEVKPNEENKTFFSQKGNDDRG